MHEIHAQDNVIHDFEEIKIEATRHFSEVFTTEVGPIPGNENLDLVPIIVKNKDNIKLIKRITMEELKSVMDDMKDDKAPGLDGFNASFIKACWETI